MTPIERNVRAILIVLIVGLALAAAVIYNPGDGIAQSQQEVDCIGNGPTGEDTACDRYLHSIGVQVEH